MNDPPSPRAKEDLFIILAALTCTVISLYFLFGAQ